MTRVHRLFSASIFTAALLVSGCSGDGGVTVTVAVGSTGGIIESGDGRLKLEIPPGALSDTQSITVQRAPVSSIPEAVREASSVSPVYELGPDGLQFALPVRLTLQIDTESVATDEDVEVPAYYLLSESGDAISIAAEQRAELDADSGVLALSGAISHFSRVWGSLPKGAGVRVRFSGVPSAAPEGIAVFVSRATVTNDGTSQLSADDVTLYASAIPRLALTGGAANAEQRLGSLSAGEARSLGADKAYDCLEAGEGTWQQQVEFSKLNVLQILSVFGLFSEDSPETVQYRAGASRKVACGFVLKPTPTPGTANPQPTATPGTGRPEATPTPQQGVIGLSLSTSEFTFAHTVGSSPCPQAIGSFTITNNGTAAGNYLITPSGATVQTSESIVILNPGESREISVQFTCSQSTSFITNIEVDGAGPGGPVVEQVTVRGTVGP